MSAFPAATAAPLPVEHDLRDPADGAEALDQIEIFAWAASQLERLAGHDGSLHLSLPAPLAEPEVLLQAMPEAEAVFWHPPGGPAVSGLGYGVRLQLRGEGRFEQLQVQAASLWTHLRAVSHPRCEVSTPRLYGGFAFAPGAADLDPWQDFGDGAFALPRWTYRRQGGDAQLSLVVDGRDIKDGESRRRWLETWQHLWTLLAVPDAQRFPSASQMPRILSVERPSKQRFTEQVEAIRAAIASGAFAKIVAARRSRVQLAGPLEDHAVLRRLRRARSVTRFAFRRSSGTFLGATPERLVSRRGRVLSADALAGSIASGGQQGAQLLRSGKDLQEHQFVVDEIVRCLSPLCERFDVAPQPRIRELKDVLHLHTPITGLLKEPRHVLDLVARLHPTPAVGGVPTAAASRWIAAHEPEPRGWYAAPVGWFDAAGDGEFAVALRSCMLRQREVFLFAGAGIVQDSEPALEYTETELKKQALLTALGA